MFAGDVIEQASQILGYCADDGPEGLYDRLTDAVEVLSNKANWDSMQGYLDITVQAGNSVILPRQVEYPIKININTEASFSRDKLFEFVLNGPKNDMAEVSGNSWMDKGTVPITGTIRTGGSAILVAPESSDDVGKQVVFLGTDGLNKEISEAITIATPNVSTTQVFHSLTRVKKDETVGNLQVLQAFDNATLAIYIPKETDPQYRKIVLSVDAPALRILFRRKTSKLTSADDFIPLHSKVALLLMLKALEHYRSGDTDKADKLEASAIKFIKEEQESLRNFGLIDATEKQPALDLSYNNADSVIVSDIYDDACQLFGFVGQGAIFDYITEACELLNNKGIWDGLEGYVDIYTDDNCYLTLPRYVETPITINVGGSPRQLRNKWFEFHLNGTGTQCNVPVGFWDFTGDAVPTLLDVNFPCQLTAIPDAAASEDISSLGNIRVFGYYLSQWIMTPDGPDGAMADGFPVTINNGNTIPSTTAQKVDRIARITKPRTKGFIRLLGFDILRNRSFTAGFYYPDETEPNYARIKIESSCAWVRMRYRKRSFKVASLTDPLHLKSKLAIMCALRSLKLTLDSKYDEADKAEQKAYQYLSEEQQSRHPSDGFLLQIEKNYAPGGAMVII